VRLDRDDVPLKLDNQSLGEVLSALSHSAHQILEQTDVALSSELKIESFPETLNFFRLPGKPEEWKKLLPSCPCPWFQWRGLLASFADKETLQAFLPGHIRLTSDLSLELDALLNNQPRNHESFQVRDALNQVNYLIMQAWNQHMADLGLLQFEMANGYLAWYFPEDESSSGMLPYKDIYGVSRRKQLIGFSPKNNLHWHYAIEIRPQFGHKPKVQLIPHVIFTDDGVKPLLDTAKMHRMRRRFCKSWWNPRWRDLLLAYMNQISEEQELIDIAIGGELTFSVASRPTLLETDYVLGEGGGLNSDDEDVYVDLESEEEV